MAVSANRLELLQIADAVAREKSIDRQIVLSSMEDAIQKAARSRYGQETEVRAEIKVGAEFTDYELPDHSGRRLSTRISAPPATSAASVWKS